MPLDNAAAQNAQNLLNGIDYSALIGGPLEAAVKAQAMAAMSTWEFIQNVGFDRDSGNAKNATFIYQKDGELVKLIVPVLTIVPIPMIVVDEVNIEFKANINASASQSTEQSESSALAGELEASGSIGWGPFSLSAKFKASYSSKKDSKATQDSKYSVEYTQDVRVHATQAGMPAGLATVLNILSNAATGASRDGDLKVSPPLVSLQITDPTAKASILVRLTDSNGLNVKGADVKLSMEDAQVASAFNVGLAPVGKKIAWASGEIIVKTGDDGTVGLLIWLDEANKDKIPADGIAELKLKAKVDNSDKSFTMPVKVAGLLPQGLGQ